MTRPDRLIGTREGVLTQEHRRRMGPARNLFDWLVARQTTHRDGVGLVLRGTPITYGKITAETGFPERTLHRWMARLVEQGYVEVQRTHYSRLIIRILKQKKFQPKQGEIGFPRFPQISTASTGTRQARSGLHGRPEVAYSNKVFSRSDKHLRATVIRAPAPVEKQTAEPPMSIEDWQRFRGELRRIAGGKGF